jgi:hypothetical protein
VLTDQPPLPHLLLQLLQPNERHALLATTAVHSKRNKRQQPDVLIQHGDPTAWAAGVMDSLVSGASPKPHLLIGRCMTESSCAPPSPPPCSASQVPPLSYQHRAQNVAARYSTHGRDLGPQPLPPPNVRCAIYNLLLASGSWNCELCNIFHIFTAAGVDASKV